MIRRPAHLGRAVAVTIATMSFLASTVMASAPAGASDPFGPYTINFGAGGSGCSAEAAHVTNLYGYAVATTTSSDQGLFRCNSTFTNVYYPFYQVTHGGAGYPDSSAASAYQAHVTGSDHDLCFSYNGSYYCSGNYFYS